ncbi:hypothetical protein RWX45_07640 [Actinomyces sp. MRS3W]|nr:hypothetical protein [Actinomyces sp. MRS3W]
MSYTSAATGQTGGASATTTEQITGYVHPVCWYIQGPSGAEKAKWFDSGKAEANVLRKDGNYAGSGGLDEMKSHFPDYASYADDVEGHWYLPACSPTYYSGDDQSEYRSVSENYLDSHDPVYVRPGETPPEPLIDGETLARAAWDAITIPTATIDYNPKAGDSQATIVGMDTWIWATGDTPSQATVTATAGSVTATVTATANGLNLDPTDGEADCTGFGIPWNEQNDRTGTDCVIVFNRSSAHLEDSVTPVDISVNYTASYTASDGATGNLGTHTTQTTTNIPVAEIQTLNTHPTKQP